MKIGKRALATTLAIFLSSGSIALTQGHGHGKGHNKHGDDDQSAQFYQDRDQEAMRGWYDDHRDQLPPGLAKKDRLPPGLEKQLVRRGSLPPGLQKRIQPIPEDLERRLPPPPPDCAHVVVGGHIVLLNRRTNIIVDIFHFEMR
jgi:Ni/Co efflux regulator RcnB